MDFYIKPENFRDILCTGGDATERAALNLLTAKLFANTESEGFP
jgi:hypothetical protein